MLSMIYSIPENIGWVLVGFTGCLCLVMAIKVAKCLATAIKERLADDE